MSQKTFLRFAVSSEIPRADANAMDEGVVGDRPSLKSSFRFLFLEENAIR